MQSKGECCSVIPERNCENGETAEGRRDVPDPGLAKGCSMSPQTRREEPLPMEEAAIRADNRQEFADLSLESIKGIISRGCPFRGNREQFFEEERRLYL